MNEFYNEKGIKKITISDVAEELGLSKTTISRAISGKGRISKETVDRVQKYIEEHNYTPNVIAKSLAQSKTYNIGVVLPADSNLTEIPFFQSCLLGICEVAASRDYDVIVATVADNDISHLVRILNNNKVDGVILSRSLVNDISATYLKERGIDFVIIGSTEDAEIVQIDNDHHAACKELTSLLIMQGMRKIALIGGNMQHVVSQNRYKGFVDALEKQNISLDYVYNNIISKSDVDRAVNDVIKKEADCIICMDDMICSHVIAKLNDEDVKIPSDIRVASFYDSAFLESYKPAVTALKFNVKELGIEAGKVLLDMLEGNEVPKKTLLTYEISLKASTKYL